MAAITTILAVGSIGLGVAGYSATKSAGKKANALQEQAMGEQKKARSEEGALNAQRAAQERRQQVREERVARGKMLQASENTGTSGSSGEAGAGAGLATQLGANIGFNLGQLQGANAISIFNQNAANLQGQAQNAIVNGQNKAGLFDLANQGISTYDKYVNKGK